MKPLEILIGEISLSADIYRGLQSEPSAALHIPGTKPGREQYREAQDRICALVWLLITAPEDSCRAKDKAEICEVQ